jgi:ribosomal protein S18 acetylase RimI-like enzyme
VNGNPLDNPFWAALGTHHAHLAITGDGAARYPADIAPFAGFRTGEAREVAELGRLIAPGESVYLIGVVPELGAAWTVQSGVALPQMVCDSPVPERDGPEWIELTSAAHRADMLALTGLVYPGFFRARTYQMGRYVGIYDSGRLVAMAGERLRVDGFQEISAVCTHPEFLGRGYAHRLIAEVSNAARARGFTPFLHLYRDNARALSLYERLGFVVRTELPFCRVTRNAE